MSANRNSLGRKAARLRLIALLLATIGALSPSAHAAGDLLADWRYVSYLGADAVSTPEPGQLRLIAARGILNFSVDRGVPTTVHALVPPNATADWVNATTTYAIRETNPNPRFMLVRTSGSRGPASSEFLVDWERGVARELGIYEGGIDQAAYFFGAAFFVVFVQANDVTKHTLLAFDMETLEVLWTYPVPLVHGSMFGDRDNFLVLSESHGAFWSQDRSEFLLLLRTGAVAVPTLGAALDADFDEVTRRVVAFHTAAPSLPNAWLAVYDDHLAPISITEPPDGWASVAWTDAGTRIAYLSRGNVSSYLFEGVRPVLESRTPANVWPEYPVYGSETNSNVIFFRWVDLPPAEATPDRAMIRERVLWSLSQRRELGAVELDGNQNDRALGVNDAASGLIADVTRPSNPFGGDRPARFEVYSPNGTGILPPIGNDSIRCYEEDDGTHRRVGDINETVSVPTPPLPGVPIHVLRLPAYGQYAGMPLPNTTMYRVEEFNMLSGVGSVNVSTAEAPYVEERVVVQALVDGKNLQSKECRFEWAFLEPELHVNEGGTAAGARTPVAAFATFVGILALGCVAWWFGRRPEDPAR